MRLDKKTLLFLYHSEVDDAILVLENVLDSRVSSRSEKEVISTHLKAKETTIQSVKEIISSCIFDSPESIEQTNLHIKSLLTKQKINRLGTTSDKPVVETPISEVAAKKSTIFEDIESNPFLTLMEKECLLSVYDPAYKTCAIGDLPDKAKRNYFRLASAKFKILKTLEMAD